MNFPDSMNPDVCAAITQVAPVFMVLLVAERVVFTTEESNSPRLNVMATALGRIIVDLALAMIGAVLTIAGLLGIEKDGYSGNSADTMWKLTFLLIASVLARWLLLSTPLSLFFEWISRVVANLLNGVAEAVSEVLTGLPLAVSRVVIGIAEGLVQFIVGVLSIGTVGRSTTSRAINRRRRHRGPRH